MFIVRANKQWSLLVFMWTSDGALMLKILSVDFLNQI